MAFKLKSRTWNGYTIGYAVVLKDGGAGVGDIVHLDLVGENAMDDYGHAQAQGGRSASAAANQTWRGENIGTFTTGTHSTFYGDGGWAIPEADRFPWVDINANGLSIFLTGASISDHNGSASSGRNYGSFVGNPTNNRGFGVNENLEWHWISLNNERVNSGVIARQDGKYSVLGRWDFNDTEAYLRYIGNDDEDTTGVPDWTFSDSGWFGHEMLDPYVVAACVAAGQGGRKAELFCAIMFEGKLTAADHKTLHNSWWTELIDSGPAAGGLVGPLAGEGGLAGQGGLAGKHGGLAG